jgi:hypothetical protein
MQTTLLEVIARLFYSHIQYRVQQAMLILMELPSIHLLISMAVPLRILQQMHSAFWQSLQVLFRRYWWHSLLLHQQLIRLSQLAVSSLFTSQRVRLVDQQQVLINTPLTVVLGPTGLLVLLLHQ